MTNKVIAGEFSNGIITTRNNKVVISSGSKDRIIDCTTVANYEVVTEEIRKSAASGVARGIAGGLLLGGVGMIAGAVSAKNKGTYQIAVEFVDGKRSLIQVDNSYYNMIVKECFDSGKPKMTAEELSESERILEEKNRKNLKGCAKGFLIFLAIIFLLIFLVVKTSSSSPEPQQTEQATEN